MLSAKALVDEEGQGAPSLLLLSWTLSLPPALAATHAARLSLPLPGRLVTARVGVMWCAVVVWLWLMCADLAVSSELNL